MMETHSVLPLNQSQREQLLTHVAAYRSYLWQAILPSPERNQVIRTLQEIQGRCEAEREREQTALPLSRGEGAMLRGILGEIIRYYGAMPASTQRNQALSEVTTLRLLLQRTFRQTQALTGGQA